MSQTKTNFPEGANLVVNDMPDEEFKCRHCGTACTPSEDLLKRIDDLTHGPVCSDCEDFPFPSEPVNLVVNNVVTRVI